MAATTHHNKGPRPGDLIEPTRQTPPPGFRGYFPQSPARPRRLGGPKSESTRAVPVQPGCRLPGQRLRAPTVQRPARGARSAAAVPASARPQKWRREEGRREGRWARGTLTRPNKRRAGRVAAESVPDAAVAAAAAGRRPPPLCLDSIDHVTLSHETRICRLPRAAQQIVAPRASRDPTD